MREKETEESSFIVEHFKDVLEDAVEEDKEILSEAGFSFSHYEKAKENTERKFGKNLDTKRIFSKSEIKKLCLNYNLRFVETQYYKGTIPPELPQKIKEAKENIGTDINHDDYFIVAPLNSLKLEKEPKDPLMFIKLTDEFYYLVHKWGNDLSITNRISGFIDSGYLMRYFLLFVPLLILIASILGTMGIIPYIISYEDILIKRIAGNVGFSLIGLLIVGYITYFIGSDPEIYHRRWNTHYE
jgi:hypothetical protein